MSSVFTSGKAGLPKPSVNSRTEPSGLRNTILLDQRNVIVAPRPPVTIVWCSHARSEPHATGMSADSSALPSSDVPGPAIDDCGSPHLPVENQHFAVGRHIDVLHEDELAGTFAVASNGPCGAAVGEKRPHRVVAPVQQRKGGIGQRTNLMRVPEEGSIPILDRGQDDRVGKPASIF